jgi:hypothetical protein
MTLYRCRTFRWVLVCTVVVQGVLGNSQFLVGQATDFAAGCDGNRGAQNTMARISSSCAVPLRRNPPTM